MVSRSRRYILLGAIGYAVAVALSGTLDKIPLMFVVVAVAGYNIFLAVRQMQQMHRRPAAFTVSGRWFGARLQHSQGLWR